MGRHYAVVRWTGSDGQTYAEVKSSWLSRERAESSAHQFTRQLAPGTTHSVEYLGENGMTRY
jgi:hypothetical protein